MNMKMGRSEFLTLGSWSLLLLVAVDVVQLWDVISQVLWMVKLQFILKMLATKMKCENEEGGGGLHSQALLLFFAENRVTRCVCGQSYGQWCGCVINN